jgi:hypothetical protein
MVDFVMLTGNTIDGRGRRGVGDFEEDLEALAGCLAKLQLPWAWLPGSAELEASDLARSELLNAARRMPGCAIPADATGFDYTLRIQVPSSSEYVDLLAFDVAQTRLPMSLSRMAVESAHSVAQRRADEANEAAIARLVFMHRPIEAYDDADWLSGRQDPGWHEFIHDGGLIRTASSSSGRFRIDGVFCGHHHHSDCVRQLRRDGCHPILFSYGRVGSFFPPSECEGDRPLCFLRGARIIEVSMRDFGASACAAEPTPSFPSVDRSMDEAEDNGADCAKASESRALLRTWVIHERSSEAMDIVELALGSAEPRMPRVTSTRS